MSARKRKEAEQQNHTLQYVCQKTKTSIILAGTILVDAVHTVTYVRNRLQLWSQDRFPKTGADEYLREKNAATNRIIQKSVRCINTDSSSSVRMHQIDA